MSWPRSSKWVAKLCRNVWPEARVDLHASHSFGSGTDDDELTS
jgi:hypothetical protein